MAISFMIIEKKLCKKIWKKNIVLQLFIKGDVTGTVFIRKAICKIKIIIM